MSACFTIDFSVFAGISLRRLRKTTHFCSPKVTQAVVLLSIRGRLLYLIDNEVISESLGRLKF